MFSNYTLFITIIIIIIIIIIINQGLLSLHTFHAD